VLARRDEIDSRGGRALGNLADVTRELALAGDDSGWSVPRLVRAGDAVERDGEALRPQGCVVAAGEAATRRHRLAGRCVPARMRERFNVLAGPRRRTRRRPLSFRHEVPKDSATMPA
jgi:hypothetical protein